MTVDGPASSRAFEAHPSAWGSKTSSPDQSKKVARYLVYGMVAMVVLNALLAIPFLAVGSKTGLVVAGRGNSLSVRRHGGWCCRRIRFHCLPEPVSSSQDPHSRDGWSPDRRRASWGFVRWRAARHVGGDRRHDDGYGATSAIRYATLHSRRTRPSHCPAEHDVMRPTWALDCRLTSMSGCRLRTSLSCSPSPAARVGWTFARPHRGLLRGACSFPTRYRFTRWGCSGI